MSKLKQISRYDPEQQEWLEFCTFPNCKETTVACPKCNHRGHVREWVNITRRVGEMVGVDIMIAHAHFVKDKDVGRHVTHKVGETMIDEKFLEKRYILNRRKLPQHVIDELNSFS